MARASTGRRRRGKKTALGLQPPVSEPQAQAQRMLGFLLGARFRLQFTLRSSWGLILGAGTSLGGGSSGATPEQEPAESGDTKAAAATAASGFSGRLPARKLGEASPSTQAH